MLFVGNYVVTAAGKDSFSVMPLQYGLPQKRSVTDYYSLFVKGGHEYQVTALIHNNGKHQLVVNARLLGSATSAKGTITYHNRSTGKLGKQNSFRRFIIGPTSKQIKVKAHGNQIVTFHLKAPKYRHGTYLGALAVSGTVHSNELVRNRVTYLKSIELSYSHILWKNRRLNLRMRTPVKHGVRQLIVVNAKARIISHVTLTIRTRTHGRILYRQRDFSMAPLTKWQVPLGKKGAAGHESMVVTLTKGHRTLAKIHEWGCK
ncbi:hypothetical protein JCM31185_06670 [Furfurilactobacillus curtus]|uniref:WxL Interacting Protein peptidoglycan binding domain-containing protein n=2 Tax=Furfurilactobacillus curtus TaxID=1746200 RepID=A0ABQ5JS64_9LACO